MFELEDYSSGFHEGFLHKYADSSGGPTLDFYISDSLQDMLDIDIRTEIATVVGGNSNELAMLVGDMPPSSFDHAIDAISSISGSIANASSTSSTSSSSTSSHGGTWMGVSTCPSWSSSSSNDYYVDVGACVNPISVMPLISSSLLHHKSPHKSSNIKARDRWLSGTSPPPPTSPNATETSATAATKSHLTFSPAQMKVAPGSIRHEHIHSHIPKQIVAISSTVTAATMAPATMATNSLLQRKNSAADAIKKDLGAELKRITSTCSSTSSAAVLLPAELKSTSTSVSVSGATGVILSATASNSLLSGASSTNTIKLAPGIGGLTFANSITYNKLKQQSVGVKSPQGTPLTANGTIILKRDRDSSPLHNMATLNANGGGQITKVLARNVLQGFTPKGIASAHSPLMQQHGGGSASPHSGHSAANSSLHLNVVASSSNGFMAGLAPLSSSHSAPSLSISSAANAAASSAHGGTSTIMSVVAVKPLQQKIKAAPIESEFPKPAYSYSCLIAMALKNSRSGSLPVSEIYSFMCEHFPYFTTAPVGWKNSVRHNLSLNKCFKKIEKPATNGSQRKGCLWAMKSDRVAKMDEEVQKWSRKDPKAILNAMVHPEHLEALERGEMKHGSSADSDVELDSQSEIEETSDLEEQELDETIVDNMFVEEDIEEEDLGGGGVGVCVEGGIMRVGSNNGIVVMHAGDSANSIAAGGGVSSGGGIVSSSQQHRDFDIEVEDIYDAIDLEDDKEAVRMAISQSDIIELGTADLNTQMHHQSGGYQSPKRARLNINYSIGPAGELEKQIQQQQQQQQMQQIKKIKVQSLQQVQQLHQQQLQQVHQAHQLQQQQHQQQQHHHQHQQQQHIVVQTITNGNTTTLQNAATHSPQYQQIAAISNHNRRKMQLVNRIA